MVPLWVQIPLVILLVWVFLCLPVSAAGSPTEESKCNLYTDRYPGLHWVQLQTGARLTTGDAVLTCSDSTVTIRSERPVDFGPGAPLVLKKQKNGHIGILRAEALMVLKPVFDHQTKVEFTVIGVEGLVYGSTDRELIRKYNMGSHYTLTAEEAKQDARKKEQRLKDLEAIGWKPLTLERQLGPWDMIWTQNKSRVEIEILQYGEYRIRDEQTDVRDAKGELTSKKRFTANSFFIIEPNTYVSARVNKIIGNVRVATSHANVKRFYKKHHVSNDIWEEMDEEAYDKWEEMLKKDSLE